MKHEKPKYVLCVAFAENGDAITGDSSGNIYIWGKGGSRISQVVGAHEGGIFSLCVLKDGTLVSGGGKDRRVVLWDHNYHKKSELEGHTDELWGLDSHPTLEQFVTCGQDKLVHLWDSTSHQPLWSKYIEDPARSAGFHPNGAVVAVGTMTGSHLILCFTDGAYLAVGSHDNFVYIYAVTENGRKYSRAGKCTGHSSFVTHLDWSADSQYIVTNSGDYEILFWEAASGKHLTSADTVRNLEWATSTCVLSFSVFGIWPDGADGTDINAVCRSHDARLLVSADDFGKVRLFPNPCSQPRSPDLYRREGHEHPAVVGRLGNSAAPSLEPPVH
ncbi:hypothetical protein ANANG_G00230250 [Anguilla anguilla]|uniref:HELP domain-containing protein n=1 Tax=Anguilla anguilla TaxID=7936 RepID=A0A9D3LUP7_ANGAN|nr:hypothetical protein ANANG_G00230250 [Anguilla anguilla]